MNKAAFFDRDGVINLDHGYVSSIDRFELVEGVSRAIKICRDAGFLIFVVTNQAGVAHGYYSEDDINNLHTHMRQVLAAEGAMIDDIRYCPYHPEGKEPRYRKDCSWRKPGAGMILDLARVWNVDLFRSFLIGDKESDLAAAAAVRLSAFLYRDGPLDRFVANVLSQRALITNRMA